MYHRKSFFVFEKERMILRLFEKYRTEYRARRTSTRAQMHYTHTHRSIQLVVMESFFGHHLFEKVLSCRGIEKGGKV